MSWDDRTKVQTLGAYEPVCACPEVENSTNTTDRATTERSAFTKSLGSRVPPSRCSIKLEALPQSPRATLGLYADKMRVEGVAWAPGDNVHVSQ